jgi:hypothetical protein
VPRQDESHKIPKLSHLAHSTPRFQTPAESKTFDLITKRDLAHPEPQPNLFIKKNRSENSPIKADNQNFNGIHLNPETKQLEPRPSLDTEQRSKSQNAARKDQRLNISTSNRNSHGSRPRKSDAVIMKEKT